MYLSASEQIKMLANISTFVFTSKKEGKHSGVFWWFWVRFEDWGCKENAGPIA